MSLTPAQRLQIINRMSSKRRFKEDDSEQLQPSSDEQRTLDLARWAAMPECLQIFIPYLDELIRNAEADEEEHADNHAKMLEGMVAKKTLRKIRADFFHWAGHGE